MPADFNTTRFNQNLEKFYWLSSRCVVLEISRRVKGAASVASYMDIFGWILFAFSDFSDPVYGWLGSAAKASLGTKSRLA
ncbi:hypothetical protein Tco_0740173 [Tanacetum coccineum]